MLKLKIMSSQKGQSLIDILVGLALVTLGVSFAAILVFGGQSILVDRENALKAKSLAREGIEGASLILKKNWSGIPDGVYGLVFSTTTQTWQFSSSSDSKDIYTRTVTVTTIAADEKSVSSTVTWQASPLRTLNIEFVTKVTNWEGVEATGGDTGGGGTSGDWQNPRTLGSIDLGPGNSATDLDVKNKIVYLSAKASDSRKPDFFIVDATDGNRPSVVSRLNTGPGLNAVDAAGNYAYVANDEHSQQLQIIDVTNIVSPTLVTSFTLPRISQEALSVFYYDSKVYVGTDNGDGPEFHIVDVSDPLNPVALGGKEIGHAVQDIYVSGALAYIATGDDKELKIYDVSNPANITLLGEFNIIGNCEDGISLYLVGPKLYFGRTDDCGHTNHHKFSILDVASSSGVRSLGSTNIGASVTGIVVRDTLAFIGTSDSNKEFQVWNISDPANIAFVSSLNFPQMATGIDYEDNLVYVSVRSNDALRIITSSP